MCRRARLPEQHRAVSLKLLQEHDLELWVFTEYRAYVLDQAGHIRERFESLRR
jgi:hypothetical protein